MWSYIVEYDQQYCGGSEDTEDDCGQKAGYVQKKGSQVSDLTNHGSAPSEPSVSPSNESTNWVKQSDSLDLTGTEVNSRMDCMGDSVANSSDMANESKETNSSDSAKLSLQQESNDVCLTCEDSNCSVTRENSCASSESQSKDNESPPVLSPEGSSPTQSEDISVSVPKQPTITQEHIQEISDGFGLATPNLFCMFKSPITLNFAQPEADGMSLTLKSKPQKSANCSNAYLQCEDSSESIFIIDNNHTCDSNSMLIREDGQELERSFSDTSAVTVKLNDGKRKFELGRDSNTKLENKTNKETTATDKITKQLSNFDNKDLIEDSMLLQVSQYLIESSNGSEDKSTNTSIQAESINQLSDTQVSSDKPQSDEAKKVVSLTNQIINILKEGFNEQDTAKQAILKNEEMKEFVAKLIQLLQEKTNLCTNLEKQNIALSHQAQSLKDVINITKDLLNIRNMEVEHLHTDLSSMEGIIKDERIRHNLSVQRLQEAMRLNDQLKNEYLIQMDLFQKLKTKYSDKIDDINDCNRQLKEFILSQNLSFVPVEKRKMIIPSSDEGNK